MIMRRFMEAWSFQECAISTQWGQQDQGVWSLQASVMSPNYSDVVEFPEKLNVYYFHCISLEVFCSVVVWRASICQKLSHFPSDSDHWVMFQARRPPVLPSFIKMVKTSDSNTCFKSEGETTNTTATLGLIMSTTQMKISKSIKPSFWFESPWSVLRSPECAIFIFFRILILLWNCCDMVYDDDNWQNGQTMRTVFG